MRILPRLVAVVGLVAVLVLAACSDEAEQAPPAGSQVEQQDQSAAAARSDEPAQRPQAEAQPAETDQAEQSAEAEQSEPEQTEAEASEPTVAADDPNAAAQAALEQWSANLTTIELSVEVSLESNFFDFDTVTAIALQLDPLTIWALVGLPEEMAAMLGGESLQLLISEDGAYLSMEQFEGWVDFGAIAGEEIMALLGTTGFDPNSFTNLEQLAATFNCLNATGGAVREDRFEGRPVWMLDCDIDPEAIEEVVDELAESGLALADGEAQITALRLIMAIDRDSGAPLLIDSDISLADPQTGIESKVRSIARVTSWNEPIEFPTPEPLVDASVLEMMGGPATNGDSAEQPGASFSPEAQLELAEAWFAAEDALALEIEADATIAGEARSADTIVLRSFSEGKYETATTLDDGVTIRFLWTRDGLWLSELDDPESGAPQWTPTEPALLGLGNQTVDEFLAGSARIEFGALRGLLESAYVERIEDASGVRYRVVFERGGIVPDDELHNAAAEFLRAEAAELLVEDVGIGEIYGMSVTFDLVGENGQFEQSVVQAEFNTELGLMALTSTTRNIDEGGWTFSTP